jgi:hypothetical protein
MSVVSYSEFQERRDRLRTQVSMLRELPTMDDTREHHSDRQDQQNVNEASHRQGTDRPKEPEDDKDQRER